MGDKITFPKTASEPVDAARDVARTTPDEESSEKASAQSPRAKKPLAKTKGKSKPSFDEGLLLEDLSNPKGGETRDTLMQKVSRPPGFTLNSLLVAMVSGLLFALLGFVSVELPSPLSLQQIDQSTWQPVQYFWMEYGFQIPLALFLGAFLGPFLGTALVAVYIIAGLSGMPLFANGGGTAYLLQPGMAYFVGMAFGATVAGKNLSSAFSNKHLLARRSFKLFGVALLSVLAVHAIGALGIGVLWANGTLTGPAALNWLLRLSVEPLPYDILMTSILLCVVRQLRLCLWLVLY